MKIIIGLGNFGKKYAFTRHNAGFMVVEKLAKELQTHFQMGNGPFLIASAHYEDTLRLIKPLTYMNRSGVAIKAVLQQYDQTNDDIFVIYDDIHLPLGEIRLRGKGRAGGHNGIESIIQALNTDVFNRLRVGIDQPEGLDLAEYVLEPFTKQEQEILPAVIETSVQATLDFIKHGLEKTMSLYNRRLIL